MVASFHGLSRNLIATKKQHLSIGMFREERAFVYSVKIFPPFMYTIFHPASDRYIDWRAALVLQFDMYGGKWQRRIVLIQRNKW